MKAILRSSKLRGCIGTLLIWSGCLFSRCSICGKARNPKVVTIKEPGQQHPIRVYLIVWGLLFLVSALSYSTDFIDRGLWRWTLILLFMVLKAGFIVAVFMHMRWERFVLISVVLTPPVLLLVLVGLMTIESDYTRSTRIEHFGEAVHDEALPVSVREIAN